MVSGIFEFEFVCRPDDFFFVELYPSFFLGFPDKKESVDVVRYLPFDLVRFLRLKQLEGIIEKAVSNQTTWASNLFFLEGLAIESFARDFFLRLTCEFGQLRAVCHGVAGGLHIRVLALLAGQLSPVH